MESVGVRHPARTRITVDDPCKPISTRTNRCGLLSNLVFWENIGNGTAKTGAFENIWCVSQKNHNSSAAPNTLLASPSLTLLCSESFETSALVLETGAGLFRLTLCRFCAAWREFSGQSLREPRISFMWCWVVQVAFSASLVEGP